jgi:hypothetical protein
LFLRANVVCRKQYFGRRHYFFDALFDRMVVNIFRVTK